MPRIATLLLIFAQSSQAAALSDLLTKMEQYVVAYEGQLSTCVAREVYVQRMPGREARRQSMTSEFLFLRLWGQHNSWLGVRNVLEVEGRPVRSRKERFRALVDASPGEAAAQAAEIARENARYNQGAFRTINVPTQVLGWLHPELRHRLEFTASGREDVNALRAWRLDFTEHGRPTLIRTPNGADLPSIGSIWVEPDTGRVLQTELRIETGGGRATIRVRYEMNAQLGFLVPVSMVERFDGFRRLQTEATYSDFRRFDVTTRIK